MKKMIALFLALMMALSCTAGLAEDALTEKTKTGTQTMLQMYINPQLLQLSGGMAADEMQLLNTMVETLNGMSWVITTGENAVNVAYAANETQIVDYTVTASEDVVHVFSSLFPNSAIKLDIKALTDLIESLIGDVQFDSAEMEAALTPYLTALEPYMADVETVLETVMGGMLTDETGQTAYIPITTHHVADLYLMWMNRLSEDTVLLPLVEALWTELMAEEAGATFTQILPELKNQFEGMKSVEEAEVGSVGIYAEADGSVTYEFILGSNVLVTASAYLYEGMECVDVLVVCDTEGTADWQATYDSVYEGTNTEDVVFGYSSMVGASETETYDYGCIYMVSEGAEVAISKECSATNVNTDAYEETTMISLDMARGEQTMNLGGIAWVTTLTEPLTAPSLEGKYVVDILAFPLDVLLNGLPQLTANVQAGMPEMVELFTTLLSQIEGMMEEEASITAVPETTVPSVESNDGAL